MCEGEEVMGEGQAFLDGLLSSISDSESEESEEDESEESEVYELSLEVMRALPLRKTG